MNEGRKKGRWKDRTNERRKRKRHDNDMTYLQDRSEDAAF